MSDALKKVGLRSTAVSQKGPRHIRMSEKNVLNLEWIWQLWGCAFNARVVRQGFGFGKLILAIRTDLS